MQSGDPLNYGAVVQALADRSAFDDSGFAGVEDWMTETMTHHYPLALERIVRGHTSVAMNPASILLSLSSGYVHSGWLIKSGIALVKSGGTHGALDDLNSTGVLLSSFVPTQDTSSGRVAALFDGFTGRRLVNAEGIAELPRQQGYATGKLGRNGMEEYPDPRPARPTEFAR
jgi:hypothetical protein